jgi:hypothetical protein
MHNSLALSFVSAAFNSACVCCREPRLKEEDSKDSNCILCDWDPNGPITLAEHRYAIGEHSDSCSCPRCFVANYGGSDDSELPEEQPNDETSFGANGVPFTWNE